MCPALCAFVLFDGVFLVFKADLDAMGSEQTTFIRVGNDPTICVEKSDVADTQQFCASSPGYVGVLAASAGEEEGCDEEMCLGCHEVVVVRLGMCVDEEEVVGT
jgi:hypothetical protein